MRIVWSDGVEIVKKSPHAYEITCPDREALELVFAFSPKPIGESLPGFEAVRASSREQWRSFWSTGAVIDFSDCADSRAHELERRVVLSQYLTAIQCTGSRPPQETGLVCNSRHGKFHLEMH